MKLTYLRRLLLSPALLSFFASSKILAFFASDFAGKETEILVSVNDGLQVYGLFTGMKPPRLSPHSIRALAFDSWAVSCSLFLMRAQSN